jgi:hypothetical protein
MTKYKRIEIMETASGISSIEGEPVEAWKLGGEEEKPDWLPAVSHTVSLPHIGNPDWSMDNFVQGAVWSSAAYPESLYIGTPIGWHRCMPGDWVTREEDGDLRVVTADEFASYYRKIND